MLVGCKLQRSVIKVDENLHYGSDFNFSDFTSLTDMIQESRAQFLESANKEEGLA